MATNTYVALDKITVGSAVASVTFSSIPSGYTDLIIVGNFGTTSGGANIALQVGNGSIDSGTNYSFTYVRGDGSSAGSGRTSNQAQIYTDYSAYATTSIASTYIWQIQNYSNTTTNKTVLGRANTASVGTNATVGLWRSTSAINTVKLDTQSTTFLSGSTFSLYGIKATSTGTGTAKATGGTITYDNLGNVYHTFTAGGTFTPSSNLTCDILTIAGGGGGNGGYNSRAKGGGGGAGGLLYTSSAAVTASTAYTITVGGGGTAGYGYFGQYPNGGATNGVDSTIAGSGFTTLTAIGGGRGGYLGGNPASGGSGGGAMYSVGQAVGTGNQGNSGGVGYSQNYTDSDLYNSAGGGGGAGTVGGTAGANNGVGGNGGSGSASYASWGSTTSTGQNVSGVYYYAGGGGGGGYNTGGSGGSGGGGAGGYSAAGAGNKNGVAATANTGGGGGGGSGTNTYDATGGNGGSGLVIIRYYGL